MIENTIMAYVISDSALYTLLGASGSDKKMYPTIPELAPATPYLTFKSTPSPSLDEHIEIDRVQIIIHEAKGQKVNADAIAARIKVLLNLKDSIQAEIYDTDPSYYIYHSIFSGGDTMFEEMRQENQIIQYYEIECQNKTATR